MIQGLILLGAGYLLGNEKARNSVFDGLKKGVQNGIDNLNKKGGADVRNDNEISPLGTNEPKSAEYNGFEGQ